MRRHARPIVARLAFITVLGGCVYDAPKPLMTYINRFDVTVAIEVEGADRPTQQTLESGTSTEQGFGTEGCSGSAIVVETEDGDLVGRVDEPACPGWTLIISEDGTLDYTEVS